MNAAIQMHDVVALLVDKPAESLVSGHVGIVVEIFSPEVFEVAFLDPEDRGVDVVDVQAVLHGVEADVVGAAFHAAAGKKHDAPFGSGIFVLTHPRE